MVSALTLQRYLHSYLHTDRVSVWPSGPSARAFLAGSSPLLMAHRGGATYGPNVGIENTTRAFANAVTLGYRFLETDVRASRDGVPVVVHDHRLDRLCGVPVRVRELDWSELARLRVGGREPLARLDEMLADFPDSRFNIDVKSDDALEPTVRAVRRAGAEHRVCLATFSDRRLRRIRAMAGPEVMTSYSRGEVALLLAGPGRWLRGTGARAGAACVQVPRRTRRITVLTPTFVRHAHELGLQVHVWTVDDLPAARAVLDLGADGLITDRVDRLAVLLDGQHA